MLFTMLSSLHSRSSAAQRGSWWRLREVPEHAPVRAHGDKVHFRHEVRPRARRGARHEHAVHFQPAVGHFEAPLDRRRREREAGAALLELGQTPTLARASVAGGLGGWGGARGALCSQGAHLCRSATYRLRVAWVSKLRIRRAAAPALFPG